MTSVSKCTGEFSELPPLISVSFIRSKAQYSGNIYLLPFTVGVDALRIMKLGEFVK